MPTKQYIKKLNGFYIKDEEARESVQENTAALAATEQELDKGYYDKADYLNLKRIMRELRKNSRDPEFSADDYSTMQGGVYIGNNLFVQAAQKGDNNVQLKEINLETGETIRTAAGLELQHANSLAYNPLTSEIYVAGLTQSGTYSNKVFIVDYDTLAITRTLELNLGENEGTHSISYDPTTGKTYLGVETKSVNTFDLYEINITTGELTAVNLINYKNILGPGGATNDMCVYDGRMYLLKHGPSSLTVYNIKSKECENIYNIPLHTETGVFAGEVESVSFDQATGDLIIAGYRADSYESRVTMFNYFITNLAKGIATSHTWNNVSSVTRSREVYVDANSTSINPTGAQSDAFATVGEALQVLYDTRVESLVIYVKAGSYPSIYLNTPKSVTIRGYDTTAEGRDSQIIEGVTLNSCQNVFMTALTIAAPESSNYDANIQHSNVLITATKFVGTHDQHIRVWDSRIEFITLLTEGDGVLFKSESENTFICHDSTPGYSLTGKFPAINKPVRIGVASNVTNVAQTISYLGKEPLIEDSAAHLSVLVNGFYGHAVADFITQTTDGGNRNVCVTLDCKIVLLQLVFDKTNKNVSVQIKKVIDMKSGTPEDITSTATLNSVALQFAY